MTEGATVVEGLGGYGAVSGAQPAARHVHLDHAATIGGAARRKGNNCVDGVGKDEEGAVERNELLRIQAKLYRHRCEARDAECGRAALYALRLEAVRAGDGDAAHATRVRAAAAHAAVHGPAANREQCTPAGRAGARRGVPPCVASIEAKVGRVDELLRIGRDS